MAKLIMVVSGLAVAGWAEGTGAYYHEKPGLMREVCRRRVANGWHPEGALLDCSWDCLAAWPKYEPDMIGRYVLADLPGGSFHV